jgi:hypothetical protein
VDQRRGPDQLGPRVAPVPVAPAVPPSAPPSAPRRPAPEPADSHHPLLRLRRPHSKVWQTVLLCLGVFVLLAVCSLTSYFIVVDERAGTDAQANGASAAPSVLPRDITSREVDPQPLTVAEVFPGTTVTVVAGQPAYQVLKTQAAADCRVAATGDLGKQVVDAGCTQVVRATLKSPTGAYLVTGGIFNLATETGAEQVHEAVKPLIDAKKGRFTGLIAGTGSQPIVLSSTHLGWDVRGHFLIYCVIARADGKEFGASDPYAKQIIYDIIELHLRNSVLEKRATIQASGAASASPAAPAAG